MKEGLVLTYLSIQRDAIVMVKEAGLQAETRSYRSRRLAGHPHSQKQRVKGSGATLQSFSVHSQTSGDLLPSVRFLFLKIPRPPETAPPTGD